MTAARRRPIALGIAAVAIGVIAWVLIRGRAGAIGADSERAAGSTSARPPAALAAPDLAASGSSRALDGESSEPAMTDPAIDVKVSVTTVEFLDADTGVPVAGCELLTPFAKEPQLATVPVVGYASQDSAEFMEIARFREVANPYPWRTPVVRSVRVPRGRVIVAGPAGDTKLVRHAVSFRVVQPVHREVDVRVTFVDDSGQPSRGGKVVAWRVGDFFQRPPVVETIAGGRVRLRGVPFVSGATLRLQCERDTGKDSESPPDMSLEVEEESEPVDAKFESPFRWPMPTSFRETIDARIPIAALAEPTILDHNEVDFDLGTTIIETTGPPTFGSLRVELRGLDGRSLRDVPVAVLGSSGTTDRAGIATLVGVPAGSRDLTVHDPGRLFEHATALVAADSETRLTVHEIEGGTLELEVVDAEGSPAPFARFTIHSELGPAWIDIDDAGEQRLDPFTDARGRRTCRRISPGKVTVVTDHGDGHAKVEVELRNGESQALRLELH